MQKASVYKFLLIHAINKEAPRSNKEKALHGWGQSRWLYMVLHFRHPRNRETFKLIPTEDYVKLNRMRNYRNTVSIKIPGFTCTKTRKPTMPHTEFISHCPLNTQQEETAECRYHAVQSRLNCEHLLQVSKINLFSHKSLKI